MQFDFNSVMSQKTNLELFAIIAEPNKYQPEALHAAKNEMESRNLSEHEMTESQIKYKKEKDETEAKTNEPLELYYYLLIFVLPVISMFFLSGYFKGSGYDRKSKQLSKVTAYYIGIVFVLAMLIRFF